METQMRVFGTGRYLRRRGVEGWIWTR